MSNQNLAVQQNIVNGVDVDYVNDAVRMFEDNKELANFKFRVSNKWIDGALCQTTVENFYGVNKENEHSRSFTLQADESPLLAGEDRAPNPVEHLLNSLVTCLTTTLVYHAAVRGIQIEELESEVEGDIDLRGFLGISDEVRRGYENVRVKFRVKTDDAENIERLKALSKLSPVYDVTSNGTNVDVQIERK